MELRSTVTFLFTDIEGSTVQWETSPEMYERVEHHFEILRAAVAGAGGEVFASMGDGIAAAFVSAESAVRAAIVAQRQLATSGLRVRMGVHTGEALRAGDDYRGRPLNRAARVMGVGHGGQILLSGITADLVRHSPTTVDLVDVGVHRLRDLAEPEHIWQVLDPALPADFPPLRGLDTFSNNLPPQRSSFVGRGREVAQIAALLAQHSIVTLTGAGGVGKTRLAVQTAADMLSEFTSTWFAGLADVCDPDDVADAIAFAAGVDANTKPLDALVAAFATHRVLLVLDNCEHVIDAAAEVVDRLTAACPGLRVVATSREPLALDGERVIAVRPLDPDSDAVELFEQRAVAAGATLDMSQGPLVRHICERLDGIPLAIELAAARVSSLGLSALAAALDDRFSVLAGGRRLAVDRHHTMRATVDWSYRLLEPSEQRLLEWMAVFAGGFELDAAWHVAAQHDVAPLAAADLVGSLARKCMFEVDAGPHGVRYRMLETVRAFALDMLAGRGEKATATLAHADWVASLTDLPFEDPCSAEVERNAIRLEREADNWRQAVLTATSIGSDDLAGRLCGPPTAFFLLGRHDLSDVLVPLLDVCIAGDARRAVLGAVVVANAGASDAEQLRRWSDEMRALEGAEPSGAGVLIEWMALAWAGEVEASVDLCLRSAGEERFTQDTRDLFLGIAVTDGFSLTTIVDGRRALAARALETVERSRVGIQRVTCLLGAAWAMLADEPNRSLALVQQALDEMPNVPSYLQRTLPGNASRLMASIDPALAAADLLDRIKVGSRSVSFTDLIPVFYATMLLHRLGRPAAGPALATLAASPVAPYLSMMGVDEIARRAAAEFHPVSLDVLIDTVRTELESETELNSKESAWAISQ